MRVLRAISLLMGFGCGVAGAQDVPLPRERPAVTPPVPGAPHSFREAAGPDFNTSDVTAGPSACDERLAKIATAVPMPRLIGPGACGGGDVVRLDAILLGEDKRVTLKPAPYLRCPMAEQLALWVRDDAAPRAATLGAALSAVETYDDFSCRGRNRQTGGKLSEHGKANAVDVRGLTLADGRFIALTDVHASKELRTSLRDSACARFTTVLGPGSDSYHEEHIHLDLLERRNGYRICQWAVNEPAPPKPTVVSVSAEAVPLPPPRPSNLDNRPHRTRGL
ncbi:extensin family protein [Pseudolabrys taiwanensis]|uniref:Extensin family protein n=1 Tax=Pseudolabrys taiwanensis TaxID=331696 RepID=A0A346A2Q1_9HYPH|nr:extensin family protein [Pseudolabrys taiwanensis]